MVKGRRAEPTWEAWEVMCNTAMHCKGQGRSAGLTWGKGEAIYAVWALMSSSLVATQSCDVMQERCALSKGAQPITAWFLSVAGNVWGC